MRDLAVAGFVIVAALVGGAGVMAFTHEQLRQPCAISGVVIERFPCEEDEALTFTHRCIAVDDLR
jgi:hypothetical protein